MAITIHTQGLSISPRLRAHMLRRFTFALYRFDNRIMQTDVFIRDAEEGRAGHKPNVRVRVSMTGRGPVMVEASARDPFAAGTLAARRCKQAVKRALKEPLEYRRGGLDLLAAGSAAKSG